MQEMGVGISFINLNPVTLEIYVNTIQSLISAAEFLQSSTAPKIIVPAPGVGRYIDLKHAMLEFAAGGTPYNIVDNLFLIYDGLPDSAIGGFGDVLTKAVDTFAVSILGVGSNNIQLPRADIENKALLLFSLGGNPTNGNGEGRLVVDYSIRSWGV